MERLQKFLARAGVASRRAAEQLIAEGRVLVNGEAITVMGTKVDPQKDLVVVNGKPVTVPASRVYFVLYKPPGVVTTLSDPQGRSTVGDFIDGIDRRLFPVGRLDFDAEGALLITDDGELANQVMHPSHEVPRVYLAKVKGSPDDASLEKLMDGVRLEDGMARAVEASRFEQAERNTWLKLVVTEGRQHLIKRLCAAIGHPVVRLFRPAHAGVSVAGLRPGQWRALTPDEVRRVRALAAGEIGVEQPLFLPARRHGHGFSSGLSGEGEESASEALVGARSSRADRPTPQRAPSRGRPVAAHEELEDEELQGEEVRGEEVRGEEVRGEEVQDELGGQSDEELAVSLSDEQARHDDEVEPDEEDEHDEETPDEAEVGEEIASAGPAVDSPEEAAEAGPEDSNPSEPSESGQRPERKPAIVERRVGRVARFQETEGSVRSGRGSSTGPRGGPGERSGAVARRTSSFGGSGAPRRGVDGGEGRSRFGGGKPSYGASGGESRGRFGGGKPSFGAGGGEGRSRFGGGKPSYGASGGESRGRFGGGKPSFGAGGGEGRSRFGGGKPSYGASGGEGRGRFGSRPSFGAGESDERPRRFGGGKPSFGAGEGDGPARFGGKPSFGAGRGEGRARFGGRTPSFGPGGGEGRGRFGDRKPSFGAGGTQERARFGGAKSSAGAGGGAGRPRFGGGKPSDEGDERPRRFSGGTPSFSGEGAEGRGGRFGAPKPAFGAGKNDARGGRFSGSSSRFRGDGGEARREKPAFGGQKRTFGARGGAGEPPFAGKGRFGKPSGPPRKGGGGGARSDSRRGKPPRSW